MHYKFSIILCLLAFSFSVLAESGLLFPDTNYIHAPESTKTIGKSRSIILNVDFEKVRDLPRQSMEFNVAKKVAYLELDFDFTTAKCSGFLVGPQLLLTNYHCLNNRGHLINPFDIRVFMDYFEDNKKGEITTRGVEIVKFNQSLDYALIKLQKPIGKQYGWLTLQTSLASDEIMLIQHPQGRSKEITRANSKVIKVFFDSIHYIADTEYGSSGSPVFAIGSQNVVAMHHIGNREEKFNEGILMSQVEPEIRPWLPKQDTKSQVSSRVDPLIERIEEF